MRTPVTTILQRIESAVEPEKPRTYLGASAIGEPCSRKLWYDFRHCGIQVFPARLKRLFKRGDREEEVFIALLRGAGMEVWPVDPETKEQFVMSDFGGHFGGHSDGIGRFPGEPAVKLEFKSYNDKRFQALVSRGVQVSDPKYYSQMQVYMHYFKMGACLFCAVNKNDDSLHFEYVDYDETKFRSLNNKAHHILNASTPPMRISSNPDNFDCRYCHMLGVCHHQQEPLKNCRSCKFGEPAENATWICGQGRSFGEVCELWEDITKG